MAISKFLNPKNDVAFKKILGSERNKDIIIHFINDILGLKGEETIEYVELISTVQDPEIASKKQSIVDVLCRDKRGVQIIVEMQASPQQGFEKRAQYYAAKAYTQQLGSGKSENGRYQNLKAVIFIAICDYTLFPEKSAYWSEHKLLDQHNYQHDLKDFHFVFLELPKFKKVDIETLQGVIEKWCYFFKYGENATEQQVAAIAKNDPVIAKAYEALNQFNWSEQEMLAYEREIKRVMDNMAVEDYIKAHAWQEGMEKGIEKGMAKGLKQGKKEEKLHIARRMLFQLHLDQQTVAQTTGLSLEELRKLNREEK